MGEKKLRHPENKGAVIETEIIENAGHKNAFLLCYEENT